MTAPAARLSRRHTISYGVGAIGNGVFVTVPGLLLLYYLTDVFGVAAGLASLALFVPKFWEAFVNPLVGSISDRSTNRLGKRRPYLLVGGIGTSIAFVLLFSAPIFSSTTVWRRFSLTRGKLTGYLMATTLFGVHRPDAGKSPAAAPLHQHRQRAFRQGTIRQRANRITAVARSRGPIHFAIDILPALKDQDSNCYATLGGRAV